MKRFYSQHIQDNIAFLKKEEAQHCIRVLRCKEGDRVEVLNGNGILYEGIISAIGKQEVQISLSGILKEATENSHKLSVAIAPTKNPARLEWFVEKATEIGIVHIFPILTDRTEKQTIKQERLQQICISAAKQSGQLFFPVVHELKSLKASFSDFAALQFSHYYIAHCENERKPLKDAYIKNESALLLIGPEGDFTKDEILTALNKNYAPVSLGNSILRVETAGVVACSIIKMINDN